MANRLNPVVGSSGVLQNGEDGNLVIMDGQNLTWSTVVSSVSNGSIVELLDSGNLVLREGDSNGSFIWQSFDYPSDCFLQNMKVGLNLKTGEKRFLTSWRSDNDPSPGNFTLGVDQQKLPQGLVWKGSARYWRTGQWNGTSFLGIQRWGSSWVYLNGFMFVTDDEEGMLYFTYSRYNDTFPSILIMNYTGIFEKLEWIEEMKEWSSVWEAPDGRCVYGTCGPFGICSEFESPICRCLNGFEPKFLDEWSKGDWSGGCVRRTPLQCEKNSITSKGRKGDEFLKLVGLKLPDFADFLSDVSSEEGEESCLRNCSCVVYSYTSGIGCMVWHGSILDVQEFSIGGEKLFLRLAEVELGNSSTPPNLLAQKQRELVKRK